jgi:hypothetical protein
MPGTLLKRASVDLKVHWVKCLATPFKVRIHMLTSLRPDQVPNQESGNRRVKAKIDNLSEEKGREDFQAVPTPEAVAQDIPPSSSSPTKEEDE